MDKRELILTRLLEIMKTIPGALDAYRDRGDLPEAKLPAIILLDGSETVERMFDRRGRGQLMASSIMRLSPQIFVILKPRTTPENVGVPAELSAFRANIIKALATDLPLAALVGENGNVMYRGSDTDMQTGSTLEGQLQMFFTLDYVLNPSDL